MQFPDLSLLFAAVGVECTYSPADGGADRQIMVTLDARPGDALGGDQISTRYEIRLQRSAVDGAVARGATFVIGVDSYTAIANGQPIIDGQELAIPVRVS